MHRSKLAYFILTTKFRRGDISSEKANARRVVWKSPQAAWTGSPDIAPHTLAEFLYSSAGGPDGVEITIMGAILVAGVAASALL